MKTISINTPKDVTRKVKQINVDRAERKILACVGDIYNGVIEVPNEESFIYVTIAFSGQVLKVKNNKVPLRMKHFIWLGYPPKSNRIQILGSAELYPHDPLPDVAHHNHTWGKSDNPSWIRREQFISSGLPTAIGGMSIFLVGDEYYLDGFHVLDDQTFDMTAYVPISGARWVNVELDSAKAFSYNIGDSVLSRDLLTPESIPETNAAKKLLFSVKTYAGQVEIIQLVNDSDIFDPRFMDIPSRLDFSTTHYEPVTAVGNREYDRIFIDGHLAIVEDACSSMTAVRDITLAFIRIHCGESGIYGRTVIDVNLNGTSIFTDQSKRPILDFGASIADSGIPDVFEIPSDSVITFDIDEIADDAEGLEIVVIEETPDIVYTQDNEIVVALMDN